MRTPITGSIKNRACPDKNRARRFVVCFVAIYWRVQGAVEQVGFIVGNLGTINAHVSYIRDAVFGVPSARRQPRYKRARESCRLCPGVTDRIAPCQPAWSLVVEVAIVRSTRDKHRAAPTRVIAAFWRSTDGESPANASKKLARRTGKISDDTWRAWGAIDTIDTIGARWANLALHTLRAIGRCRISSTLVLGRQKKVKSLS